MRTPRSLALGGPAALLWILSISLIGCPTVPGDGDGTGGVAGLGNLAPIVVMTSDIERGVAPLTVRFSSSGSTDDGVIVERRWDFGDGASSVDISPAHTFLSTGLFTATLTLTDDRGATSSKTLDVSVTERPVAVIDVDDTSASTAPATFEFDGSASFDPDAQVGEELEFAWDFDDGSRDSVATLSHTFARAGTYRVTLVVTDATGVTGTATRIIEVGIQNPVVTFLAPPDDLTNIALSTDAPLWAHITFEVEPGVPRMIRAGLDGDRDLCNALTALYDPRTGEELDRLSGHEQAVRAAAFSPDGQRVLSAGDDGTVRLYDSLTGVFLREYVGGYGAINALAFNPTGTQFVIGAADGTVATFDVDAGLIRDDFLGHANVVHAVAFSPLGDRVFSGDDDGIAIVWDAASAGEWARFTHLDAGAGQPVYAVAFWPINPQALVTGAADRTARMWSSLDGQVIQVFAPVTVGGEQIAGHTDAVTAVAFSGDGLQLATGSADGTAKVWGVLGGTETRTFTGHGNTVNSVAFSPDGLQVLSGGADGTARIWDVASGSLVRTLAPCESPITAVAYASDGTMALTAVAAENDIQLDTVPQQGNDLNLTLPTGLDLTAVPTGANGRQYFLWAELDTDRSEPARAYANATIQVVPAFSVAAAAAPLILLGDSDEVTVVMPAIAPEMPAPRRQVFDIGPLSTGDRLFVNLLTTPGYGATFQWPGFSLLILDEQESLYAWYQHGYSLFSGDSKLIIGHDGEHHYVAIDNDGSGFVPSVTVRVERGFAADSQPRGQRIFLDFDDFTDLSVRDSLPFYLQEFDAGSNISVVKDAIEDRLTDLFAAYDVEVARSDGTGPPHAPYLTIYFDTADPSELLTTGALPASTLQLFGVPEFHDPRNGTLGGFAVVVWKELLDGTPLLTTDIQRGVALGSAAAHQVGLLAGLRETGGVADDVMGANADLSDAGLTFDPPTPPLPTLWPHGLITPIGTQNSHEMLLELFGTP